MATATVKAKLTIRIISRILSNLRRLTDAITAPQRKPAAVFAAAALQLKCESIFRLAPASGLTAQTLLPKSARRRRIARCECWQCHNRAAQP